MRALTEYLEACALWNGGDLARDARRIAGIYGSDVEDVLAEAYLAAWVDRANLDRLLQENARVPVRNVLVRAMERWAAQDRAQRNPIGPNGLITDVDLAERLGWWHVGGRTRGRRGNRLLWTTHFLADWAANLGDPYDCSECMGCDCYDRDDFCQRCKKCDHGAKDARRSFGFTPAMIDLAQGAYQGTPVAREKLVVRLNAHLRKLNGLPDTDRAPAKDLLPADAVEAIRKWKVEDQRLFLLAWVELWSWERIGRELSMTADAADNAARRLRKRAQRARSQKYPMNLEYHEADDQPALVGLLGV